MEIAFIHPSVPQSEGSGATHSATKIIRGLANQGHDVTVYCIENVKSEYSDEKYDIKSLKLNDSLLSNFPEEINSGIMSRESELASYDIVHSYLMRSIPAMGKIGLNTTAKTIVTLNAYGGICPRNDLLCMGDKQCTGNGLMKCATCSVQESISTSNFERKGPLQTLVRSSYRVQNRLRYYRKMKQGESVLEGIAGFHALSPPVKQHYIDFGFPADRIHTIPNVVDECFIKEHSSDFTEPFKLLHVGRIKYRKGVDRLIDVVEEFSSQYDRKVSLTIVGDGQMLPTIRKMIDNRGLDEIMSIYGHVDYSQLPSLYAEHDLFVYLGRWDEPFGRVFLESLGTGTPVFATDVGDIKNIVGDAGYITNSSSASDIAADLDAALDRENLRKKSKNAKQVIEDYKMEKVWEGFHSLYTDA